jgi:hypothetical protein
MCSSRRSRWTCRSKRRQWSWRIAALAGMASGDTWVIRDACSPTSPRERSVGQERGQAVGSLRQHLERVPGGEGHDRPDTGNGLIRDAGVADVALPGRAAGSGGPTSASPASAASSGIARPARPAWYRSSRDGDAVARTATSAAG